MYRIHILETDWNPNAGSIWIYIYYMYGGIWRLLFWPIESFNTSPAPIASNRCWSEKGVAPWPESAWNFALLHFIYHDLKGSSPPTSIVKLN